MVDPLSHGKNLDKDPSQHMAYYVNNVSFGKPKEAICFNDRQ